MLNRTKIDRAQVRQGGRTMVSKECPRCHNKGYRRLNRVGVLQERILPFFGYFPWECVFCRTRFFFRDDGHKSEDRAAERERRRAGVL